MVVLELGEDGSNLRDGGCGVDVGAGRLYSAGQLGGRRRDRIVRRARRANRLAHLGRRSGLTHGGDDFRDGGQAVEAANGSRRRFETRQLGISAHQRVNSLRDARQRVLSLALALHRARPRRLESCALVEAVLQGVQVALLGLTRFGQDPMVVGQTKRTSQFGRLAAGTAARLDLSTKLGLGGCRELLRSGGLQRLDASPQSLHFALGVGQLLLRAYPGGFEVARHGGSVAVGKPAQPGGGAVAEDARTLKRRGDFESVPLQGLLDLGPQPVVGRCARGVVLADAAIVLERVQVVVQIGFGDLVGTLGPQRPRGNGGARQDGQNAEHGERRCAGETDGGQNNADSAAAGRGHEAGSTALRLNGQPSQALLDASGFKRQGRLVNPVLSLPDLGIEDVAELAPELVRGGQVLVFVSTLA